MFLRPFPSCSPPVWPSSNFLLRTFTSRIHVSHIGVHLFPSVEKKVIDSVYIHCWKYFDAKKRKRKRRVRQRVPEIWSLPQMRSLQLFWQFIISFFFTIIWLLSIFFISIFTNQYFYDPNLVTVILICRKMRSIYAETEFLNSISRLNFIFRRNSMKNK